MKDGLCRLGAAVFPFAILVTILVELLLVGHDPAPVPWKWRIFLALEYGLCLPAAILVAWKLRGGEPSKRPYPGSALVVLIFLLGAAATTQIHTGKYIGDENAYRFQARVLATGRIGAEAPPMEQINTPDRAKIFWFRHMFIRDHHWFGQHYPGWPALLSVAVLLRSEEIINPVFALALMGLTYLIAKQLFDEAVAGLSLVFLAICPFFLYNSTGYLSHPSCAVALAGALWFAIRAWRSKWI